MTDDFDFAQAEPELDHEIAAVPVQPAKRRGRPPKAASMDAAPKRRGRPPKAVSLGAAPKRRGRPPLQRNVAPVAVRKAGNGYFGPTTLFTAASELKAEDYALVSKIVEAIEGLPTGSRSRVVRALQRLFS